MLAHAVRIEVPGRTLDIVGTGGDRSHTVNISTMSALVIAGAGHHRRQARQPRRVVVVRLGGRARGARHPARPPARPHRGARHRGGHHLLLRAGVPPVVPAHRRSAHRAGHRHRLQLPRAAHQPRPAAVRRDRCRRGADGTAPGRRARRTRGQRARVPRRGRSRRDRPDRSDPHLGGPGRRRHRVGDRLGDRPRRRADHARVAARGEGGLQRRRRAAAARRPRPVPCARPSCSTRRPRSWRTAPCPAPRTARSSSAWRRGSEHCACGAGQRRAARRDGAGALAGCQRGAASAALRLSPVLWSD